MLKDLSYFFTNIEFPRFAYSCGRNKKNDTPLENPQILAHDIATAILDFNSNLYSSNEIHIFLDRYTKGAYDYGGFLEEAYKSILAMPEYRENKIKVHLIPVNKSTLLSGNEIADFITHTAGCQARRFNEDDTTLRRDFDDVFNSIDKSYIKYSHYTKHSL